MASVDHIPPPVKAPAEPLTSRVTAPPIPARHDSIMTVDMHIPGAWNGTNPGTPAPIGEDIKYFGETLKTVHGAVQNYLPAKEQVEAGGSTMLNKAAALVPASVMNTATNVLPKSMQPTMSPTAADANPPHHPSNEHPITTTTNKIAHKELDTSKADAPTTLMGKTSGVLPASLVGAVATYLPVSMTGRTAPASPHGDTTRHADTEATNRKTALDSPELHAKDPVTKILDIEPTLKKAASHDVSGASDEKPTSSTWTEKSKSILPVSAVAAFLPTSLGPKATDESAHALAPTGEEGLNAPLPPVPSNTSSAVDVPKQTGPLIGSTVSPDEDVQEALSKAANPHEYTSEIIPPTQTYPYTAPSHPLKDEEKSTESPQEVSDGYPAKNKSGVSGPTTLAAGGGVGAMAVDHSLKDQREAAMKQQHDGIAIDNNLMERKVVAAKQHDGPMRPEDGAPRPTEQPKDSFFHVVIPATPGAGLQAQEPFEKKGEKHTGHNTLSSGGTLKKKDRSGSISAGEASPSSPSKSGMFSGIRKLTKKRDRSVPKGHERNASHGDSATPVPTHADSLDTQNSNSTGNSPTSAGEEKERKVLHKDPPAPRSSVPTNAGVEESTFPTAVNYHTDGAGSTSKRDKGHTPGMLANPFSPNSPPASPSKVGFREKMKGELMVVQGTLTRDHGLKEAGEKMKKGTM